MKKIIGLFLIVALCIGSVACGSSSTTTETPETTDETTDKTTADEETEETSKLPLEGKVIGFSPYWLDAANSVYVNTAADYLEMLGAECQILDPNGDSAVQRQQIQDWITMGVDGVIWSPCETSQLTSLTKMMQDADIRVAVFWNIVPEEELEAEGLYVPQYELNQQEVFYDLAVMAVDYVKNEMGETPKAIIFDGASNPVLHARATGFSEGLLAADSDAEILFNDEVEYEQDAARDKMLDLITTYPEFNIVSPHTGNASVGAFSALQTSGRGKLGDEWFVAVEGDNQRMDMLLDDSTSCMALMLPDVYGGGETIGQKMEELLTNDGWKEVTGLGNVGGLALTKDKKEEAIAEYAKQNSTLDDYEEINLSEYE